MIESWLHTSDYVSITDRIGERVFLRRLPASVQRQKKYVCAGTNAESHSRGASREHVVGQAQNLVRAVYLKLYVPTLHQGQLKSSETFHLARSRVV